MVMNRLPLDRRPIRALVLAVVVLALATIDWSPDALPGSGSLPPAANGTAPLQFAMKNLHGADVQLDSFRGKVVFLNFWATWCGPCRAEIPDLISLQASHPDDVAVVGVVVMDRFGENVTRFASEMRINYPVLDGTGRPDIENAFAPLWGLPTTLVIDRHGHIVKRHSGIGSVEQFEREIRDLL
jgi:cytochrome c biogenesis protein CcmG, thiol:disulfide interchange protein DsbE